MERSDISYMRELTQHLLHIQNILKIFLKINMNTKKVLGELRHTT